MKVNSILFGKKTLAISPSYRHGFTLRNPVPWDKRRGGVAALKLKQRAVTDAFTKVSKETRGLPRSQRTQAFRELMKGVDFGGVKRIPRSPLSPDQLEAKIKSLRDEINKIAEQSKEGKYGKAVVVTAT